MNTRISKLLILVLALVMVLSVLAGCVDTKPTTAPTQAPTTDETKAPTDETKAPEDKGITFPLAEPYYIELMIKGSDDVAGKLAKSTFYQKLCKDTNVFIKPIMLGDDPVGSLNAKLVAKEYGHAIMGGVLSDTNVGELAYGGWLLPLEGYLTDADLMPNYVGRGLSDVPGAVGFATIPDGHCYGIPRIDNNMVTYMSMPLIINTKWMEAAGLSDVATIEKFEQYMKYIKDNDVNGNENPNDEIPLLVVGNSKLDSNSNIQALFQWWGMPTKDATNDSYAFVKDGKVELAPTTQGYKDAVSTIAKWYKEGWLWSECYTTNKETYSARLNSETPIWGAALTRKMPTKAAYAADLAFVAPPAIEGYEARIYVNPGVLGYKNTFHLTNKCTEEDARIIMAWVDQMYSEEGTQGYLENLPTDEDASYKWEDGKIVSLSGDWTTEKYNEVVDKNPRLAEVLGANLYLRNSDWYENVIPVSATNQALWDAYNNIYKDYWNHEIWPRPTFTEEATEDIAFYQTDVYAIINEYEAKWVTGKSDINADWDAYIAKMENAGSKELTALLQEAYDVYLQNYKAAE